MGSMKPTNVRWYVFIALLALCTINYVDRAVISICMPSIEKELGFSPALVGVILSSFFWGYAAMQIPAGWLSDKVGSGPMIVGSGIFWGIFQVITGFISSSNLFMAIRVLLGIAESPIYPASAKLQSVWLTADERGRGAAIMDSGAALGTALGGPMIVAFMAWFGGWRGALVGAGIVTMVIVILCRKFVSGTPDTNPLVNEAEREYIKTALNEEYATHQEAMAASGGSVSIKDYFVSRNFWGMILGFYCYNSFWYGLMTWSPLYLSATQHLNINGVGGAIFIIFGMGVCGELIGGYVTDKLRKTHNANTVVRMTLLVLGLLMAACMLLLSQATSVFAAIGYLTGAMFFQKWAGCLYWGMPAAISQRNHVGSIAGIMNFIGNMGGVIIPIAVGLIVQYSGGSYYWALMMFMGLAIGLGIFPNLMNFEKKVGSRTNTMAV